MPAISRRLCTCVCPGTGTGTPPGGVGLPDCLCAACTAGPCFYEIDFGCCLECDGLRGGCDGINPSFNPPAGLPLGAGLLHGRKVTRVWKDGCAVEAHCLYTARKVAAASDPFLEAWPLTHLQCGGWYDFHGFQCAGITDRLAFLATTRVTWSLAISGSSATLTGTSDSGSTLVYQSRGDDPWVCPTPGSGQVNRLWMMSYPDTLNGNSFGTGTGHCRKFPPMVCITPGLYGYQTYCADPASACACCDAGASQACFQVDLNCTNGAATVAGTFAVNADRNASLPSGVSDPGGVCGYFWGLSATSYCQSDISHTSPFNVGLLVWCDGADWKVRVYCRNSAGTYALICDTTATRTACCPNFAISWSCPTAAFPTGTGTGTGGQVCFCCAGTGTGSVVGPQNCCCPTAVLNSVWSCGAGCTGSGTSVVMNDNAGNHCSRASWTPSGFTICGGYVIGGAAPGFRTIVCANPLGVTPGRWRLSFSYTPPSGGAALSAFADAYNEVACPGLLLNYSIPLTGGCTINVTVTL